MAKETAEADDLTVVRLGNRAAIEVLPDPDDDTKKVRTKIRGPKKNYTELVLPAHITLMEAAQQITDPNRGIWQAHSDDKAPAWVAGSGPLAAALTQLLGAHYGVEVREFDPAHGEG
jgi:hypothetical protein